MMRPPIHRPNNINNPNYLPVRKTNKSILERLRLPQINSKDSLQMLENTIGRVHQVLKYIEKSGPYIEKYGPLIKEMPTMYKVMKAINELEKNENNNESLKNNRKDKDERETIPKKSQPKLYI